MSSVNPNDTYNGYFIKHLSDYEDELKTDYKRAQQRSRDDVEQLSHDYEESRIKSDEKAKNAVDSIREETQEKYDRSRESDRAEIERIKRQQYDRFGRDRTNEADLARQRLDDYARSAETERKDHEHKLQDTEVAGSKKAEDLTKQYEDRLSRAVEAERASAEKAYEDLNQKHKSSLEEQRDEGTRKYEALSRARMDEQQDNRRRTDTLITDAKRDMDNLRDHTDASVQERLTKNNEAVQKRMEDREQLLHDHYSTEGRELRDKLHDLMGAEKQYVKDGAQARAEVIHGYEDEWRGRENMLQNAHEKEVKKLQELAKQTDDNSAHSADRNRHDRDIYFTGLLAKQNQENREEHQATVGRYDSALKEMEARNTKDRKFSDDRLEGALHTANEGREYAMQQKRRATSGAKRLSTRTPRFIDALQKQLNKSSRLPTTRRSPLPSKISPSLRRAPVRKESHCRAGTQQAFNRITSEFLF